MPRFQSWTCTWIIPSLGLALALGLPGCGPSTPDTSLTGVVKQGDKPLTAGTVYLYPQEGADKAVRQTAIGSDGKYTFAAPVPTGQAKLTVKGPGPSSDSTKPASTVTLDPKYADPDKSGLSWNVKDGKNNYDISLAP